MFRRWPSLMLLAALSGCCHAQQARVAQVVTADPARLRPDDTLLAASLIAGDEERTRNLTQELLDDKRSIENAELTDDRRIAPNIVLRATYENHDYQLGVSTVSEYALCVLQIKNRTSSENVLRIVAPALLHECTQAKPCEVCNAQAFPVRVVVKQELVKYWTSKLRQPGGR